MDWNYKNASRYLALMVFAFYSTKFSAQNAYKPLRSSGEIPEEFRSLTATKVQRAQSEDQSNKRTKQERRHINEFLLRNNYVIDEFLTSGKILFGDPITNYVNEVAAGLLDDDPQLKNKLRFYTVKSAEANAFATNQGIIFITIGLLAQIENEAQLAFILAHEIAHYQKNHSIATVLENVKVYNSTSTDRYAGSDERIRLLSTFSKDKEFEADSLGFLRYVLSGYRMKEASSVMDVLYLSSMPYAEVEFNFSFLSFGTVEYPKNFRLDSIAEFPYSSDDYDDSKSTHPNIRKRKDRLDYWMSKTTSVSEKRFIKPEAGFEQMQLIARQELVHLFLLDNQYIDALYISYVSLQSHPGNRIDEENLAKSLYGISKYTNGKGMRQIGRGSKKTFGEIQRCYYFFETLTPKQINLIAIRYINDIYEKYKSPFMEKLMNNLVLEAVKNEQTYESIELGLHKYKESKLAIRNEADTMKPSEGKIEEIKEEATPLEQSPSESKYDKYRIAKKNSQTGTTTKSSGKSEWESTFHYIVFEPLMTDVMKEKFQTIYASYKAEEERSAAFQEGVRGKKKKYARKGFSLGIDKMIFVDPFFMVLDQRRGYKLVDSEERLIEYKTQINECADKANIEHDVLVPKIMQADDIKRYNSMSLMNDWIGERISHSGNSIEMIPLETEYTTELADEYGTDYFCYTGIIATKESRPFRWGAVAASIVVPYFLPFTLVRAFVPRYRTNFYFLLYDVREGDSVWTKENITSLRVDDGGVRSALYDTFYQVKRKSKR